MTHEGSPPRLRDLTTLLPQGADPALGEGGEAMWLEVIAKMDEVYSDLLRYETDLERKNSELEEARDFISSVIASVSDILIVCDRTGRIVQVNPAFLALVGMPDEELIGEPLTACVAAADRDLAATLLRSGRETPPREVELRFVTREGVSDLMAIHWSGRFDRDRRRVGAVLTGRPVGELRRAYEALHRAHLDLQEAQSRLIEQEKMASLGRLVAGVAHELNNPISFVYGNIHTLDRYRKAIMAYMAASDGEQGAEADAELRRRLRIDTILADLAPLIEGTLEGAVRISDIVKNLRRLSFSRPSERGPVDLEQVIRNASRWAVRSSRVGVQLDLDLEPDLIVQGHEGQIHQVVVNLLDNALHASRTAPQPRIRVALRRDGETVELTVADNGGGIGQEAAGKIFEPFFTTKTVGEGTGLGLWISYSIVREHGGTIVGSNAPEGGAVFTMRLPIAEG